jgi:hypothetical protein
LAQKAGLIRGAKVLPLFESKSGITRGANTNAKSLDIQQYQGFFISYFRTFTKHLHDLSYLI